MNQVKTGELIRKLRTDRGLTQKQIAEKLHVSNKAVSKWECGNGCPDLSLLTALSEILGIETGVLLSGKIDKNEKEKGNMKKLKFYVCKDCGNIITATSNAAVSCCGNKLTALEARKADTSETLTTEDIGGEWYITSNHEMTKEHYISFVAYVSDSCVMMFKQYPEWGININLPMFRSGRLVWYCSKCGLLYQEICP
ncbi:MAG: helix-turn-helix domain-containing protein [Oscillospiraceae bacterium]|nr:helix-turn-helix domain-containing protein [Oscillospiraceae bacterium]